MKTHDLSKFTKEDTYSLCMFSLYKLIDDPKYSSISELPYILDEKNFLNLCKYFGGTTIKVPTVDEVYSLMNVLLLYDYVHTQKINFEEAFRKINWGNSSLSDVKKIYNSLSKVLDNYEFKISEDIN